MSFGKRTIALCLSIAMIIQLLPFNVMATENEIQVSKDEQNVTITAHANKTVTVKEKEDSPIEPVEGSLLVVTDVFDINRDYEQNCEIMVTNPSNEAKQFYLEADNDKYSDLSYQFIGSGSPDASMFIAAGESVTVTLSIFAQNAEKDTYYIPITAYVLENNEYAEDAKQSITLNCEIPTLDLSWNLDSSSKTSLSQTYTITNNGDKLTDLAITASDELKDYVSFSPIISNHELKEGASVQFTVSPDLVKMKNEKLDKLRGKLIASCAGKTSEHNCDFDTKGQKITTTTMGELALKQDGNSISKFEIISDNSFMKYYKGTDYVDVSDNTTQTDILDGKQQFNIEYDTSVDLGIKNPANFQIQMKSLKIDKNESIDTEPIVEINPNGNEIKINTKLVMTSTEYQSMLGECFSGKSVRNAKAYSSKEDIVEKGERFLLDTTFQANDILSLVGSDNDFLGGLSDAYDFCNMIEDGIDVWDVSHDPSISEEYKYNYLAITLMQTILTGGKAAVSIANPLIGTMFSLLTLPLGLMLNEMKDQLKKEMISASELYYYLLGHQCTNRGSVSAKFYVPDYTKGTKKPSMHASSRMSGNGYVNKQETNYNVTLNGKPAGTTQNSGLTDVLMTEIPTNNLIPGEENTIVFDYDTSPGSHSVTTDTKITLMYPNDTEIAYIGEPDDLQDVRTKPDFAVYSENIYANDPIIGEETNLHFNIYNIGSRGGWFTIICKDADTEDIIYTEENHYLSAFSSEQFTVPWIPQKENTNIEVNIENTSIDLEERDKYAANDNTHSVHDDRNNHATQLISARKRLAPKIQSITADHIYENEPFSAIVNVTQCSDLVDAVFTYNGTEIKTKSTGSGKTRRYCLYFDKGMPNGKYTVNAEFKYNSSAAKEETSNESVDFTVSKRPLIVPYSNAISSTLLHGKYLEFSVFNIDNLVRTEITVDSGDKAELTPTDSTDSRKDYSVNMSAYSEGEHNVFINMYYTDYDGKELVESGKITVKLLSEKESYYMFSLSENIANANPKFSVYRNSYSKADITVDATENGYKFLKTLDMVNNPSNYSLVVAYDFGVIVKGLDIDGNLIDETECHTLTTIKSDTDQITYAAITRLPGSDYGSVTIPVSLDTPIILSPGTYGLRINGKVDEISFYRDISINVSDYDQEIDLNNFALVYYLDAAHAGSSVDEYRAKLCVHSDYGWNYTYMDIDSDTENNILKCYSSYEWFMSQVNESKQTYLLVYSNTEAYFIPIKDEAKGVKQRKETITLDKSALKKVSIINNNENLSVGRVNITWNDLSADLYGDTFYIPDGEYKLQVGLTDGSQTFSSEQTVNISEDCEVIVGEDINVTYSNVTVNWSDAFDTTSILSCYNTSKNWNSSWEIESGDTIKVLDGECTFRIELTCRGIPLTFTKEMNTEGNDMIIEIGDNLTGDFLASFTDEYEAEESICFSVTNVSDLNGNKLYNSYFDTQLNGEIVYTDIGNADKIFTVPIHADDLYDIYTNLPNEPGTYSVDVKLNVDFPKEELMYNVTINDSYADISGAGRYENGAIVTINAGKRDNYNFTGWTSSDVTFDNPNSKTTTFIMPAMDVSVTAQWNYNGSVLLKPGVPPSLSVSPEPSVPPSPSTSPEPSVPPSPSTSPEPSMSPKPNTSPTVPPTKIPTRVPSKEKPVNGTNLKGGKAYYNVSKKGTAKYLKPTTKNLKSVTIPLTVKIKGVTYKVTSVADKAFLNNKKLRKVTISNNIITIGNSAFQGCKALKTMTIGKRVRIIGKKAFYDDSKLKTITVKSTFLKKVGGKAFYGIHKKAMIKVPKKKLSAYKKLFKNKGHKRTVQIKKDSLQ